MGRDELMNIQTHVMTQNLPVVYAFAFLQLSHILHSPIFYKRRILEGLTIQQLQPSLNKQFHRYKAKMKVATNIWSPCPRSLVPCACWTHLYSQEKKARTQQCTQLYMYLHDSARELRVPTLLCWYWYSSSFHQQSSFKFPKKMLFNESSKQSSIIC